ncbi:MAG: phenylalanine--tRNA ligase subunit beta [Acidobacteriia bacterium]|nr:phenylalanine--tRNA ligase subunit beta [Terriglobia bacterium]
MKISLGWLKEFVEVPAEPRELRRDLTMLGLNVESISAARDGWVLDVEVTTNRPDCLSHYGVAREAATFYRRALKPLEFPVKESAEPASSEIAIEIADPDLCGRYCGRVVQNVEVKPSPEWLQKRLEAVGQRPINNVADVTNYVLMELGHPLHAFDLSRLRQRKIIVRRAKTGEHLRTRDDVDRALGSENLVIADAQRAVALAGVMGGEDSEISSSTRAVLLESAWFEPVSIRRTAKAQGMHTEASHRFERGADIQMAPVALDRAATLIAELAGGEILRGMVDVYPRRELHEPLLLRRSIILRVLGAEISWEEVERILRGLGFETERRGTEGWRVTPASFRLDVTREVDLVEEVARHYGYDKLPTRLRSAPPRVEKDLVREKELAISARLVALGYREIIPSSMVDPAENARFTDRPPVVLANPLSQEASALRSSPIPSMLRALRWNLDRGQNDVRLFEVGKTYSPRAEGLADERRVLTLGLTGHRKPVAVYEGEKEKVVGIFDFKGDIETLLEAFEIPGLRFEPEGCRYFDSAQGGRLVAAAGTFAVFGRLDAATMDYYKLRQDVWLADVDLDLLLKTSLRTFTFREFSRFPAVERDFSLLVPEGRSYHEIEGAVRGLGLETLQSLSPGDVFRGGAIAAGHYSLLLRVVFQSPTHTLTSEEVAGMSQQVLGALERLGIRLRT